MHAIQYFLIVVLCGFVWLTIILGLALAGEATISGYTDGQKAGPGWEELWDVTPRRKGRQGFPLRS